MSLNVSRNVRLCLVAAASVLSCASTSTEVLAQVGRRPPVRKSTTKKPTPGERTLISLTIITSGRSGGLRARLWQPVLKDLGVRVRIRTGTIADKPGVKETKLGSFRRVTMTGKLDRRGRLVFDDRAFTRKEASKLKDWVDELKTYGAQGAPNGKPLWGLSKSQFGKVYDGLSSIVKVDVHGKKLGTAQSMLKLPDSMPLRYSFDAKKYLAGENPLVRKHIKGHALGTGLALMLRDLGLGFRPVRTPKGTIELVVDPLKLRSDAWPIGWKPKASRVKTAPKLFVPELIQFEKAKLLDVYYAYSVKTGVPVHFDYYLAAQKSIDPAKLTASYKRTRMTPSVVLKEISGVHRLIREIRIDEKGHPFVWITVFVPKRLKK